MAVMDQSSIDHILDTKMKKALGAKRGMYPRGFVCSVYYADDSVSPLEDGESIEIVCYGWASYFRPAPRTGAISEPAWLAQARTSRTYEALAVIRHQDEFGGIKERRQLSRQTDSSLEELMSRVKASVMSRYFSKK